WYISFVVVIFAFLGGIVTQDQLIKPNQEIVLHFQATTLDHTEDTIAGLKLQLQEAGVTNIQVLRSSEGTLKIVYFSKAEVSDIEKILSDHSSFEINEDIPEETPSKRGFEYDVYEIQANHSVDLDLQGTTSSSPSKSSHDRVVQVNPFATIHYEDITVVEQTSVSTFQYYNKNRFYLDQDALGIPEVRAGPLS
ncbi:MAG: hypothetical protein HRU26_14875, partial [Psychroserpens sp.]|nr:hypothetical protein [Psychroserpens sp.]